ncbi:uncharacterized protein LOC131264528 [Anopheles coustani]|uniref:uncharacterized protein LOC131264528 n=1 Tax=Anopheles coustani TaxID=139045 RepID=UPI002659DD42|nr:uncharacterized protein LOC131264528 [Anopheles coustani]
MNFNERMRQSKEENQQQKNLMPAASTSSYKAPSPRRKVISPYPSHKPSPSSSSSSSSSILLSLLAHKSASGSASFIHRIGAVTIVPRLSMQLQSHELILASARYQQQLARV